MSFIISTNESNANKKILTKLKELINFVENDPNPVIDIGDFYNTPFSILILASTLRKLHNRKLSFDVVNERMNPEYVHTYLENLGFYKLCGIDKGLEFGRSSHNNHYVPIQEISIPNFIPSDSNYDKIEVETKKLCSLIAEDKSNENVLRMIKHSFREIIRNVFEHAGSDYLFTVGQKFNSKKTVEIAFLDEGIGVFDVLKRIDSNIDEKDVLSEALMPGVSSKSNHKYLSENSDWLNSGWGLYVISQIVMEMNGQFIIASGNYALIQNGQRTEIIETKIYGTAISLSFETNNVLDFNLLKDTINEKGQELTKRRDDSIKKASRSSWF
jgi:hypothetical protein